MWEAIEFDGVITERQKDILKAFPDKVFTHRDCAKIIGSSYLHEDLCYLVDLGVLEKRLEGRTGYYNIRKLYAYV